jgi:hypothetical protein
MQRTSGGSGTLEAERPVSFPVGCDTAARGSGLAVASNGRPEPRGACLIDGQGGAEATAIRAQRHEVLADRDFAAAGGDVARVAALSEQAYTDGVRLHLDAAEHAGRAVG